MKKIKLTLSSFAIIAFMVLGVQSATAQKAYFNSKTSRKIVNQETLVFTCDMQELQSKTAATVLAEKIKSYKGVRTVEVKDFNVNKANFVISVPKKQGILTLQNSFLAAGIQTVYLDNKAVKTSDMATVVKGMNKKK
jgi:hypothetical protein